MKVLLVLSALIVGSSSFASVEGKREELIPVCGALVAKKHLPEITATGKTDKYVHCSVSCVMTLYCGFLDSFEIGVLKEVYDALGYGTPSIQDLRADLRGIRFALQMRGEGSRSACYQACSIQYP